MLTIRAAKAGDVEALLALYVQLSPGNSATDLTLARRALREIEKLPNVEVLVAERDGAVVGTAMLVIVPNLTHGAAWWAQVENMVVDAAHRGAGLGQALLESVCERAWSAGCYKVQLQSANERDGAHRFYERFGFRPSSVGFRLYREQGRAPAPPHHMNEGRR